MLADIAFFIVAAFLAIPTIGAYYAHSRGRNFWLWFFIGCFLPVISYIILLCLPDKKNPFELELEKLRIDLGILGTSPDIPLNDPLRKEVLKNPPKEIAFNISNTTNTNERRLAITIDGKPLVTLIKAIERPFSKQDLIHVQAGDYVGLPLSLEKSLPEHFLGNPSANYANNNRTILLVDRKTGNPEAWSLAAEIKVYRRHVVWCNFMQVQRKRLWRYDRLGIIVFDKLQYLDALHELTEVI